MNEIFELAVLIYLVVMNLVGFIIMGVDKKRAQKGLYRIPEKVLFLVALFGGCFGATIGMNYFRHKTKHWYFFVGMPLISIAWGYCIFRYFLL